MNCQEWIFATNPKSWTSWRKSYAVGIVGSPQYSFWTVKSQIFTYISNSWTYNWKSSEKMPCILLQQKRCALPWWYKATFSMRNTRKKYWIFDDLFYPINHIYQILHQFMSTFFILYKILCISKIFSRRCGENVCEQLHVLETSYIFLAINRQATWYMVRGDSK